MESSRERACPSCSAPAQSDQHWCLECGAELPQGSKRSGLRPAVGIATTLAVLVGAASAGGYTLLQDGKKPPPPATTVAQEAPPAVTPPATDPALPPTDPALPPAAGSDPTELPDTTGGGAGAPDDNTDAPSTPPSNPVPDLSDELDTSTPNPPPPDDDAGDVGNDDGSVRDDPAPSGRAGDRDRRTRAPAKPRLVETNIALGAVAVVYPPSATDQDLGDAGAVVDGSKRTSWRTPPAADPAAAPPIGVYVDLASAERLNKLIVNSPTPGAVVEVYGARNGPPQSLEGAGWTRLGSKTLGASTTFGLPADTKYRFVLVLVTGLPAGADQAAISEVEILSKQPE